jgi:hypothetical protein
MGPQNVLHKYEPFLLNTPIPLLDGPGHPSICTISVWCLGAHDWAAERAAQVRAIPAEHAHLSPGIVPGHTSICIISEWCLGARDWAAEHAAQVQLVPYEHAYLSPGWSLGIPLYVLFLNGA